jgi:hypothetical protein
MQTVTASTILEDAERLLGWDLTQLETRQNQMARTAFSLALQEVWEAWWWEELMLCQPIPAATIYSDATPFTALQFCYFPASQKYYQALRPTTGNAPAGLNNGAYAVNAAWWAEVAERPAAGDFDATAVYVLGNQARDLVDGQVYQCFVAPPPIIVTGAGYTAVSGINGNYSLLGTLLGHNRYGSANGYFEIRWVEWFPGFFSWAIGVIDPSGRFSPVYQGLQDAATPDLVVNWWSVDGSYIPDPANDPAPTVFNGRLAPSLNAYCWAKTTPFIGRVNLSGTIRSLSAADPRGAMNAFPYPFELDVTDVLIFQITDGAPWVWYRRPTPVITGDDYSDATAYTANDVLTFN